MILSVASRAGPLYVGLHMMGECAVEGRNGMTWTLPRAAVGLNPGQGGRFP